MNKLYKNGNGDGDPKFMEDFIDFLCKEKKFKKIMLVTNKVIK
jgi:hypothetical protein